MTGLGSSPSADAEAVVVLAPFGDDAHVLDDALRGEGIRVHSVGAQATLPASAAALAALRPAVLILTEEALGPSTVAGLVDFHKQGPPWSAPPLIILCNAETDIRPLVAPVQSARADTSVTVLRRPATREDLLTAVHSARRVRDMQIRMRDLLAERKQSEDWAHFLLNELSHRTKNMFAMVLALASQTMRQTRQTPETFMKTYEGRVRTLAEAYSALTRHNWQGATLADLAEHVVLPLAEDTGEDGRVTFSGPDIAVPPATATTLALALHELATNACKYGAFSNERGMVAVTWAALSDGRGRLEWRERGGPPVTPPTHTGFGTRVITSAVRSETGGEAEMLFDPQGLTCVLCFQINTPSAHQPVVPA